jgi:hypothetical protein
VVFAEPPPPPPPVPISATYTQRSQFSADPATEASMQDGIFAETTRTITFSHSFEPITGGAWVQMDFGVETAFEHVYVGCDFDNTLDNTFWGKVYTEDALIIGSNNLTDWTTLANTGTFTQGIQSYATPGASYRYVRIRMEDYNLALTEFYATTS